VRRSSPSKKQVDEKNKEIVDLRKALEALEEQNQELTVALKSRNEEIKALKFRIGRLENDKEETGRRVAVR